MVVTKIMVPDTLIHIATGFISFLFMEFVAWFSHKYIMHGFLWTLHKDHHIPNHKGLERNDLFAFIFATPSFLGIYFGLKTENLLLLSIGIGIATYGLSYFLYHDLLYHQRIKLFRSPSNWYLKAIIKAHYDHHAGKKNYGFLFMVPYQYIKEAYIRRKQAKSS
jgi:beta-carotene 3-hydroxylase